MINNFKENIVIGLYIPKYQVNIGSVIEAAISYDIKKIIIEGYKCKGISSSVNDYWVFRDPYNKISDTNDSKEFYKDNIQIINDEIENHLTLTSDFYSVAVNYSGTKNKIENTSTLSNNYFKKVIQFIKKFICNEAPPQEYYSLLNFTHPKKTLYIFGYEKENLPEDIIENCDRTIEIPTKYGVDLITAINIVLYDRLVKYNYK